MSTAPVAPTPRRNPKQKRNPADEVIESGEIVERRSMVVRSSSHLPQVFDDPTEISVRTFPAPRLASSTPWRVLWLVAALIAGGVAASTFFVKSAVSSAPLTATADAIGTTLDTERNTTLGRAEMLASSPMIRVAVGTDAATMSDMVKDRDVMFPHDPEQVIEVVQVSNAQRTVLLRLPAEAAALEAPTAGTTKLALRNNVLGSTASAPVAVQGTQGVSGEIVTWRPIDLSPIVARLTSQTSGASIGGLAAPLVLVAGAAPPNVQLPITTRLTTEQPLTLAMFVPPPKQADLTMLRFGCVAAMFVMLVVYLLFTIRARRAA